MTKKAKLADLESALSDINTLIDKMEHSDLTLEQALAHFEQGISLIKNCQIILKEAEQKVQLLIQSSNSPEDGSETLTPYSTDDNAD